MRVTVLCDNNTTIDRYLLGEPAFSALIEDGARTILFDAGYSEVPLENARRLGLDLASVTDIVLSHGHNDHTGGLSAFFDAFRQPVRLIAHPDAFLRRRDGGLEVGCPLPLDSLGGNVTRLLSKAPVRVSEHAWFLGQIERTVPFEAERSVGMLERNGAWEPDALPDDSSLLLQAENGGFLITGCAHAGICNTVRAANALGVAPVRTVLGGFHLFEADEKAALSARMLQELGVETLYPCHCTSLAVKALLMDALPVCEVGVGLTLEA